MVDESFTKTSPANAAHWAYLIGFIFVLCTPLLLLPQKSAITSAETPEVGEGQAPLFRSKIQKVTILREKMQSVGFKKAEGLYHPIIVEVAERYQVNPALVKAIIMAESGFKPRAVSKRGAKGLMQLMPRTAEALGVKDSFNPEHNINGGVKYFKKLLNQFDGDIGLALAAYNAGSRKVREYGGIPPFEVTRRYVEKVFKYYEQYKKLMSG